MHIIAADVGGTKTHLVYADSSRPGQFLYEQKLSSTDFDSFDALLKTFIKASGFDSQSIEVLSLALPGPVENDVAKLTNLPWIIEKQKLIKDFDVRRVSFMNDFQASALGTLQLTEQDRVVLNAGKHDNGAVRVVVGAGTGLGLAWIQKEGADSIAYSTEGGHVDFAPTDQKQVELLQFLVNKYGHVSYERVLSGQGLVELYEFFAGQVKTGTDAAWVNVEASKGNRSAVEALQMFVQIYGAYVGNLALLFKPDAGIYITGGVGPKIQSWMQSHHFIDAYLYKGRMQELVRNTGVYLVTHEKVGVLGVLSEILKQVKGEVA